MMGSTPVVEQLRFKDCNKFTFTEEKQQFFYKQFMEQNEHPLTIEITGNKSEIASVMLKVKYNNA
jgi:hypothetical protein